MDVNIELKYDGPMSLKHLCRTVILKEKFGYEHLPKPLINYLNLGVIKVVPEFINRVAIKVCSMIKGKQLSLLLKSKS